MDAFGGFGDVCDVCLSTSFCAELHILSSCVSCRLFNTWSHETVALVLLPFRSTDVCHWNHPASLSRASSLSQTTLLSSVLVVWRVRERERERVCVCVCCMCVMEKV